MPEFLTLDEWGGTSAGRAEIAQPVPRLYVHHSVTQRTGNPVADFRQINWIGLGNGHGGISYSYVIEGDVIGEGQGLRKGAHTAVPGYDENPYSLGVCFVGNFNNDRLTDADVNSFRWLRDVHLAGKLVANIPTDGHRNAPGQSTACPGNDTMLRLDDLRAPYAASTQLQEDRMQPVLFQVPGDPAVYLYDPNNHTKTHVTTPEALSDIQALMAISGVENSIHGNLAAMVEDAVLIGTGGTATCQFKPAPTAFKAV